MSHNLCHIKRMVKTNKSERSGKEYTEDRDSIRVTVQIVPPYYGGPCQ